MGPSEVRLTARAQASNRCSCGHRSPDRAGVACGRSQAPGAARGGVRPWPRPARDRPGRDNASDAEQGPPDGPRRVVPAPRARRRAHARRARAWSSTAPPPAYEELATTSRGACTSSRATASGSRSCRSARAGRSGSTTRTSTSRYHVRHTALPPPGRRAELKHARRARCSPSELDRTQAAVGDLARRGARGRPLRARSARPTTRSSTASRASTSPRSCSTPARPDAAGPPPDRLGPAPAAHRRPAARRRAARARHGARARSCAACAPSCAARGASPTACAERRRRSARWRAPARAARRPRRSTSRSGPTAASPGSTRDLGEFKAIKDAARRDGQRRRPGGGRRRARPLPAPPRRATPTASCCARWSRSRCAPTPSAARWATRSRRCGRRCRSASRTRSRCFGIVHDAMEGLKESGQAVGAQALTELDRLRAADDHRAGGAPAVAPALLQPRRDERARPAVPALRARARAAGDLPGGAARRSTRRSASRS